MILEQPGNRMAEPARLAEIIGTPDNRLKPAEERHVLISQDELVRLDLEFMIVDRARAFAAKIEIGMVSQRERRRPIGGRLRLDHEVIVVCHRVGNGNIEVAGISLFAIGTAASESQRWGAIRPLHRSRLPHSSAETARAAVKMIRAIVGLKSIDLAIELEARICDPSSNPSDDGAEVATVVKIIAKFRVTQNDIGNLASPVRHQEPRDDASISDRFDHQSAGSSQRPCLHRLPGWERAEPSRL